MTEQRSTDSKKTPSPLSGEGVRGEYELLDPNELDPALAMPSPWVYRGSLIALLFGSIFAIWLLVLPPVGLDRDQPPASIGGIVSDPTPTQTAVATPSATVIATATGVATSTASPTAAPTATEAPVKTTTYTVQPGDTLFGIGELFLPAGRELNEFIDEIAAVSGISDPTQIQVGQVLDIPGR